MTKAKSPGVSRENRLSDEGLQRLEKLLATGAKPSAMVLRQWVKRYGHAAETIINKYNV